MKIKNFLRLALLLAVCAVLVFAASSCGAASTKLETPTNLRYDGATITWNAVSGATGYKIQINDGNEYTVGAPAYPFDAAGGTFSVVVKATSTDASVQESDTLTQSFMPMPGINEIRFNEFGEASWDPVDTATAYAIRIDGQEKTTVSTTNFASIPAGTHSFQVRPIVSGNNSYYSSWSKSYSVNILGTVAKDDISYNNGVITWKYVQGAQYYQVLVNGIELAAKNSGTSVLYDANNTGFSVNVRAIGNGSSTFTGALSDTKEFIFLDTVTNIIVENGIVKWDAVGGADGYTLKLNGVERNEKITKNEYANLAANVVTEVQIRPYSNDTAYFSDWSAAKSILILPAPILKWNQDYELDGEPNNNAYWDGVSSAEGYTVRLTNPDGTVVEREYGSTERSFAEAYLSIGTYKVEVKSNAATDSSTVFDSVYSAPITVVRLATPKAASQNFITSDPSSLAKGFTVTYEKVAGAAQYELLRDNNSFKLSTTNQFVVGDVTENNVTTEQNYNFAIRAKGSVKPMNGQIFVTLDSLTEEALTFNIKVLPSPTNPSMDGYKYTYGTIEGAEGYVIDVGGSVYTSTNREYDLSILEAGNFAVKVCARGNGSNVLASNYTAPINVQRLAPPTNIRVSVDDTSEGTLTFQQVMHATGYFIVFNNDGNAIPVSEMMNVNQYITVMPGTDIHMIASANYYNEDNTVYYMTSRSSTTFRCIKLDAPGFGDVAFSDTQFIWNVPSNINTSIYTPTYIVYDHNGIAYNGEKNGTTMDISNLEGGRDYTFSVKAIGNGQTYVNSAKSDPRTIYKLATPVVIRDGGKYVWQGVTRATGYVVYVDGVIKATFTHQAGMVYEYTPDFDELKSYKVEVQAIGDEGYSTISSKKCTIIQETKQLTSPDFKLSYSEERYSETGKLIVTITEQPAYATGYSYTIGGTTHVSTETTYSLVPGSTGTFEARVYAIGGSFDENGIYYLDSQSVSGGSSKRITLLGTPNFDSIEPGQGYVTWNSVKDAVGYDLIITINGIEFTVSTTTASYTFENYSEIKTISIRISAKGNGGNVVSSVYCDERSWNTGN